jgi:hypothetical protein
MKTLRTANKTSPAQTLKDFPENETDGLSIYCAKISLGKQKNPLGSIVEDKFC